MTWPAADGVTSPLTVTSGGSPKVTAVGLKLVTAATCLPSWCRDRELRTARPEVVIEDAEAFAEVMGLVDWMVVLLVGASSRLQERVSRGVVGGVRRAGEAVSRSSPPAGGEEFF